MQNLLVVASNSMGNMGFASMSQRLGNALAAALALQSTLVAAQDKSRKSPSALNFSAPL